MSRVLALVVFLSYLTQSVSAAWFCTASASVRVCGFAGACNFQMVFGNGISDDQFLAQQQAKTACETSARIKSPSSFPVCVTSCSPSSSGSQTQGPTQAPVPTQAPTQPPTEAPFQCREGTNNPSASGELEPDSSSWSVSKCQSGQHFCVTFFDRNGDNRLIMSNCADSCTPSVFTTAPDTWTETTCCSTSTCNNDLTKLAQYDWNSARTQNVTGTPATVTPTSAPTTPIFFGGATQTGLSIMTIMMTLTSIYVLIM